jgi:hypothetical protein
MAWAGIAEICLVGVIIIWLISPSAAAHAGYGHTGSITLLALSAVLTATGVVVALSASRLGRGPRLTVAITLAVVAGSVIPLALTDLVGPGLTGVVVPLALAVIGMEFLAVFLIRVARL